VKHFYKHIIEAITSQTSLSLEQYVFFPLHTEVDDEHGKTLLNIAAEISKNSEQNLTLLSNGMLMALELRAEFWNQLLKETNQIIQACTN
ncbi:MAG: cupin domain protein, partial [Bacteroidota bacterium]